MGISVLKTYNETKLILEKLNQLKSIYLIYFFIYIFKKFVIVFFYVSKRKYKAITLQKKKIIFFNKNIKKNNLNYFVKVGLNLKKRTALFKKNNGLRSACFKKLLGNQKNKGVKKKKKKRK